MDINARVNVNVFKDVVRIVDKLFFQIPQRHFFSPYSIVPLISQILGLNNSLMGSGDSPYSLISIIGYIKKEKTLFRKVFSLALNDKRQIVDEIFDMIIPSLLEEEDEYIELLETTKYKNIKSLSSFRDELKQKFAILTPFLKKFIRGNGDFAYIAHYGCMKDIYREHNFLKKCPSSIKNRWSERSYPVVNEIFIKNFNHGNLEIKNQVKGWVIFVANSTEQLLKNGELRRRKILQCAKLAKKLGAKIIGMGGLVASFAGGGYYLSKQVSKVGFTTGHAFTISNILEIVRRSVNLTDIDIKNNQVAVVGAAGSIGSGCAKLLVKEGSCNLCLIDTTSLISYRKLKDLEVELKNINPKIHVELSDKIIDIKKSDLVIVATNSPLTIIKPQYLKKGAVLIDDSFPKNISKDLLYERSDVLFLEGGAVRFPFSIDINISRNMPDLIDVPITRFLSCKETYSSFSETLILALTKQRKNYGLGNADTRLAEDILSKAGKIGISVAPLQCFDQAVDAKKIKDICKIREGKR